MPLWGSGREGSEVKPLYLTAVEKRAVYATTAGWTQAAQGVSAARAALADREVLVAIGGLSGAQAASGTGLAAATISSLNWNITTFDKSAGGTLSATVNYNEAVTVAVSNPTIAVTNGNEGSGSGRGPHTLTYASGTGTNRLTFTLAIGAANAATNADDVLVIGAQNITLASSSTIVDDAGNAQVAISAAHGTAAGTILVVA